MRIGIWPVLRLCAQYIKLIEAAHDLTSWLSGKRWTLESTARGAGLIPGCAHIVHYFSSSF